MQPMRWRAYSLAVVLLVGLVPAVLVPWTSEAEAAASALGHSAMQQSPTDQRGTPGSCSPDRPCAAAALIGLPTLAWIRDASTPLGQVDARVLPTRTSADDAAAQASVSPDLQPPRPLLS
jgi:hypothetical protein